SSKRVNRYFAKTPQAFMVNDLKKAYSLCENEEFFTDDAGVYCNYVGKCKLVEGGEDNVKLTYPEDFNTVSEIKVGTGFDLHKLVENRKLILGGIEIPHDKGLLGHSDADVLTHAIMDALLSSLSMRDIGYHFSDKDAEFKDISSMVLLERVMKMITDAGYVVNNVSAVVMAEKPKMAKFVPSITENLAKAMNISVNNLGITLTTLEGIGVVGREEGIAVQAYCSVKKAK
ncbi:MAG: 2-C-methyl-D-erythritol 2,4-cyclodiphosphate synthase, partial [Clostridia bacterium]|nr:2-C-methyl-D-erythritol 2,4-cyclodiphosphate synthase [Clostridia bacterium]